MEIDYSDGLESEAQILALIRQAKDRSSRACIASEHYRSWPVRYHLCPERANLLRPFDFSGLEVLELGAGMGAVSRFLAEQAKSLHVVEGTQARFDVLAERLADLENWTGEVGNFQHFSTDRRFDVICLIGVLEYSELFLQGVREPHQWLLQRCRQFLKPGGVVFVAIENALGLKYWNGAAEDHRATLFDGICGYPDSPTPRTFSRKQLKELFHRSGFSFVKAYYPFPDYKVPTSILSQGFIDKAPAIASELASLTSSGDYLGLTPLKNFNEGLASEQLSEAGLLADFSNSFLFVGCESESSPVFNQLFRRQKSGELAWHYGHARKDPIQTIFQSENDGVHVKKSLLYEEAPSRGYDAEELGPLTWVAVDQPLSVGKSVRSLLARHAYFAEWEDFFRELETYLCWVLKENSREAALMDGKALDSIFVNARLGAHSQPYVLFDQEWQLERSFEKSWFVFRNVFNLVRDETLLNNTAPFSSLKHLYEQLCQRLHLSADFEGDLRREARLQQVTSQGSFDHHLFLLRGLFERRLGPPLLPRDPAQEIKKRFRPSSLGELRELPARTRGFLRARLNRSPKTKTLLKAQKARLAHFYQATRISFKRMRSWNPVFLSSEIEGEFTALTPDFPRGIWRFNFGPLPGRTELVFGMRVEGRYTTQTLSVHTRQFFAKVDAAIESLAILQPGSRQAPHLGVRRTSRWEAFIRLVPVKSLWKHWANGRTLQGTLARLRSEIELPVIDSYGAWIQHYDTDTEEDKAKLKQQAAKWSYQPLISILVPVYNTDERWLRRAVQSVCEQVYPHWELCLADDASTAPHIPILLQELAQGDGRIKVISRKVNGHISAASNSALEIANGEFVALLDHDDELAPQALFQVASALNENPDIDVLYSDEDKIDRFGRRYHPVFKPDWNCDLFYSKNYVSHLGVYRTRVVRDIGGFRLGFEGSQDYDLALRVFEKTQRIHHIPKILYHWRAIPGSVALAETEKAYAHERAREAIHEHFKRRGISVEVQAASAFLHRVRYSLPDPLPKISVLVPTRDRRDLLEVALNGLLRQTDYPFFEILVIDNQTADPDTLEYFRELKRDPRVRILRYDKPFNYSAMMNLGAQQADADYLLLFNNDLKVLTAEWLKEMLGFAAQPDVGCVGAKLLFPDGTIQHAGVVLGVGGVADHLFKGAKADSTEGECDLQVIRTVSAVSAACLLVRKDVFERAGGFDEKNLPIAYNDIDFCLRVRELGLRNVWTPYAQLTHWESASRGSDAQGKNRTRLMKESAWMQHRWGKLLQNDPFFNPNLSLKKPQRNLAFPPRVNLQSEPFRKQPCQTVSKSGKSLEF